MLLNAYCTTVRPPDLDFPHTKRGARDRSDPELASHLRGFAGFILRGGSREMTSTLYAVLQHLQRVQHHFSFEVDEAHFDDVAVWAEAANCLLFTPDGCVRAPSGAVLVDAQTGDAEREAQVPYPADAIRRKAASERGLVARKIATFSGLPPVIAEGEVELRAPSAIAQRCLALFVCAVRAESLASGRPIPVDHMRSRMPLAFAHMSDGERAFMNEPAPSDTELPKYTWRYEAIAALLWALGETPALPFPDSICDVSQLSKSMLERDASSWIREAKRRPTNEILDALDMTFRLHWATTNARVRRLPPPVDVDPGVVLERHYALNWLVQFENADWDDVTTPT